MANLTEQNKLKVILMTFPTYSQILNASGQTEHYKNVRIVVQKQKKM